MADIADGISHWGEAFAAWANVLDRSAWPTDLGKFLENYVGCYDSLNSWAIEVLEECDLNLEDHVPSWLLPHVRLDIEAFARDLSVDYEIVEARGSIWVFASA